MATGGEDFPGDGARKKTFFQKLKSFATKKGRKGEKESLLEASSSVSEDYVDMLRAKISDIRNLISGTQFNTTYQRIRLAIDTSPAQELVYNVLNPVMGKMDQYRQKLEFDIRSIECELSRMDLTMAEVNKLEPKVDRLMQEARYVHEIMATINSHRFCIEELDNERQWFERYRPNDVPDRSMYELTYLGHPWTLTKDINAKFNEYGEVAYAISREFMTIYRALQNSREFPEKQNFIQEMLELKDRFTTSDSEVFEIEEQFEAISETDEIERSILIMRTASNLMRNVGRMYQWRTRMFEIDRLRQEAELLLPEERQRSDAISEVVQPDPFGGLSPIPAADVSPISQPNLSWSGAGPSAAPSFGTLSPIHAVSSSHPIHGSTVSLSGSGAAGLRLITGSSSQQVGGYGRLGGSRRKSFDLSDDFKRTFNIPDTSVKTPPPQPGAYGFTTPQTTRRGSDLQFHLSTSAAASQATAGTLSPEQFMLTPEVTPVSTREGIRIPGQRTPLSPIPSTPTGRSPPRRRLSFSSGRGSPPPNK